MRTWHRRLGIAAALLLAWLALTGVLLNHTEDLGLDERHLASAWLLDWYGIREPEIVAAYRAGDDWILQAGERIYFNEQPLEGRYAELRGAAVLDAEIAVAADERILLLSPAGALLEALDDDFFADSDRVRRAERAMPPEALARRVARDYRGRILSLERVLLDLHSGRVLGLPGLLLMDLAALAALALAVTGLCLWLSRR